MTSLHLLAQNQEEIDSPVVQKTRRPLKTRWHYGRAYGVIAAIAPFVLISLLVVHLHTLGQQWAGIVLSQLFSGTTDARQKSSI